MKQQQYELVYQTADGETEPTSTVIGRVNTWRMEVEVVSFCIPGASTVSCSDMRPTVAIDAEGPQSAISKIDAPATDEVTDMNSLGESQKQKRATCKPFTSSTWE